MDSADLWAVVLAGGEGRRLAGFLRQVLGAGRPKQFCRIVGSRTMLRHTWDRARRLVPDERIVTIITAGQEPYLEYEAAAGVPGTVLVQPENKETAPGLLLPILWIARRAPAATAVVFPADHFVWNEERFAGHARAAAATAGRWPDGLTLLGAEADGPEVEYGWIAPGAPLPAGAATELYTVDRFWEKPDRATAARLLARGYFWNTLVLAGRVQAYLGLAAAGTPHILLPLREAAEHLDSPRAAGALASAYRRIPAANFSRALLARSPGQLLVLAARNVGWSDWGDPERIVRSLCRFHRSPSWLPRYARLQATPPAAGLPAPGALS